MSERTEAELDRLIERQERERQTLRASAAERDLLRLPTPPELEAAYRALIDGTDPATHIAMQFRNVVDCIDDEERPDFEAPTFETIGRLFIFATDALSRLDEIRGYVAEVLEKLDHLDELRLRFSDRGIWGA